MQSVSLYYYLLEFGENVTISDLIRARNLNPFEQTQVNDLVLKLVTCIVLYGQLEYLSLYVRIFFPHTRNFILVFRIVLSDFILPIVVTVIDQIGDNFTFFVTYSSPEYGFNAQGQPFPIQLNGSQLLKNTGGYYKPIIRKSEVYIDRHHFHWVIKIY